jgi:hypothetical protein
MKIRPVIATLLCAALLSPSFGRAQPSATDGEHDFDFAFGTWATHISVMTHTSHGVPVWARMNGTVVTRKVWSGRSNLEEIEADGSSGRFEGMTLRLYDPKTREWNLYWSDSSDGTMGVPAVGAFRNGRGEFYDQEPIGGKMTFVRQRYYDVTPASYRFEQALSHDGGVHWEPNFVASLTREPEPSTTPKPVSALPPAQHDFDWQFGSWKTRMSRLERPLSGSTKWTPLNAHVEVSKIWGGRANLAEIAADGPGHLEFLALRIFQPETKQWMLNFASSSTGEFGVPLYGAFKNGRGVFYDQERYGVKTIWIRFSFFDIGTFSARDEQAFSSDAGQHWEINWKNFHTRTE